MAINFKPKVGQILECNYGAHTDKDDASNVDGHIPPEMVKNRLVVVLNGRLGGGCLVVPLSSTFDTDKTSRGIHVEVDSGAIIDLRYFVQKIRWAKADMIQHVSRERLNRPKSARGREEVCLASELVERIQRAVIKAIGAQKLLLPPAEDTKKTGS